MLDISTFSVQPRRLWRFIRVGATVNDPGNVVAKSFPDIAQPFRAAAIFHRIMKKRADRLGLVRPVLKRDRSDAKNMRDVRNPCFLASLIPMRPSRINQRFLKLLRQLHLIRTSTDYADLHRLLRGSSVKSIREKSAQSAGNFPVL